MKILSLIVSVFLLNSVTASANQLTRSAYELAEAYVWYSLSGHQKSLKQRDHFARKLSREEIIEAQRRAMELFEGIQQNKAEK